MSSFSGLSTALSALYAHRRGLDLTGQNVANANTDGYSRQRLDMRSAGASAVPAMWAVSRHVGEGVTIAGVQRLRDSFLESRAHTEHGRSALLTGQQSTLARIEQTFNEPSDTGLQGQLADFWAGWADVANHPEDLAARSQLLQRAATLTDTFRRSSAALDGQWTTQREQLATTVATVNTTATNVAELNQAIRRAEQAGVSSNDLKDQRDLLVMSLADLTGGTVRSGEDGVVDVYLGGTALVRGDRAEALAVTGATELIGEAADPVRVVWAKDGYPTTISAGTAGAIVDALDITIPDYRNRLDGLAADLAGRVNAQHVTGYDLDGNSMVSFFAGTTAESLTVTISDPRRLAASDLPGGVHDGANADRLARIGQDPVGPDQDYRQFVVELGVQAQTVNRRVEIQAAVTTQVDAARDAQAGVNLDEEMMNMLAFQHAYDGAARVLTTIDQALDTLINRTGIVGR